jgi:uncharacterized protein (TIGR01244 family)
MQKGLSTFPITEQVVLAAQPQPEDWSHLVAEGFHTIVNIRADRERALVEGHNADAAGLCYLYLPLPAVYDFEVEHVGRFREALKKVAKDKTLFHCRSGWRVGLLWMLNRVIHEAWTPEEAIAELRAAGYVERDIMNYQFYLQYFFEREEEEEEEW